MPFSLLALKMALFLALTSLCFVSCCTLCPVLRVVVSPTPYILVLSTLCRSYPVKSKCEQQPMSLLESGGVTWTGSVTCFWGCLGQAVFSPKLVTL